MKRAIGSTTEMKRNGVQIEEEEVPTLACTGPVTTVLCALTFNFCKAGESCTILKQYDD